MLRRRREREFALLGVLILLPCGAGFAQLFDNLQSFGSRLDVGDPETPSAWFLREGPKGVAAGDLDGDGSADLAASNLDGTITVYLNRGDGTFGEPRHLRSGVRTLREVILADVDEDGLLDVAAAAPVDGKVVIFRSAGGGDFAGPSFIATWRWARNLAAGDFDGDGRLDLAVGGSGQGLRQYRGDGEGNFTDVGRVAELAVRGYSKPVYSLRTLRVSGRDRDDLVATHAWSETVWTLSANDRGILEVESSVANRRGGIYHLAGTYHLAVGPVTSPASGGAPDLVTAHRNRGVVVVRESAPGGGFREIAEQVIDIPGGPRAVEIIDLDGDGWNDLVVVLRYLHRILTYRNEGGVLVASSEMPVGVSPRDVACADLNGDGQGDLAVINRVSSDVSVLLAFPGEVAFGALDQYYLVDGEVAGLEVTDLDADGRDDVIQLHRASGDASVRLARADGSLEEPVFYAMGAHPNDMRLGDVDQDGILDLVVAAMGERGAISENSWIAVRPGKGDGTFGPSRSFRPPPEASGSLFSLEVADFDGDGVLDLAAGYFDCRLALFRGAPDGTFTFRAAHRLIYESRALVSGDFDQDGDIDFAGGSATGAIVVIENTGDLFEAEELTRYDYEPPSDRKFGTRSMVARDIDGDGDLDLAVGSGNGVMVYAGREGIGFELLSDGLPGTHFAASSVATGDLDGDGKNDVIVACQVLSCVVILTQDVSGKLLPALSVDVPAGRFVTVGDLDGDGHADVVGSGEALWTALSSRAAELGEPPELTDSRHVIPYVVINEVLAVNNEIPLDIDGGKKPDWLELFSGADEAVSLADWKLVLTTADEDDPDPGATEVREFVFPPDTAIESGGRVLVIYSKTRRSPLHTGFKIPGSGGRLELFDAGGEIVDSLTYLEQRDNVSYGRYADGIPSFVLSPYPTPGAENEYPGNVGPDFRIEGSVPAFLGEGESPRAPFPGEPIRFFARGEDDVGIVTARILYQDGRALGGDDYRAVVLYDDGLHRDGGNQDGLFSGVLEEGIPQGRAVFFQVEIEDISDNVTRIPDSEVLSDDIAPAAGPSSRVPFYSIAVGAPVPSLEISELVARNDTGLVDESGGTPDWVEIRNCGGETVSLDGLSLGKTFPAHEDWFSFPQGSTLEPGGHVLVLCDGSPEQGPFHAPFVLPRGGSQLYLVSRTAEGAHQIVDALEYGEQEPDRAYARGECGGSFGFAEPTPGTELPVPRRGDVDRSGNLDITDAIVILGHLFRGSELDCRETADVDADGGTDLTDVIYLLGHLFQGGAAPPEEPAVECE